MVVLEFSGDVSKMIMVYQGLDYIKSNNFTNLKPYLKLSSVFERYEKVRFNSTSFHEDNLSSKGLGKGIDVFLFLCCTQHHVREPA